MGGDPWRDDISQLARTPRDPQNDLEGAGERKSGSAAGPRPELDEEDGADEINSTDEEEDAPRRVFLCVST